MKVTSLTRKMVLTLILLYIENSEKELINSDSSLSKIYGNIIEFLVCFINSESKIEVIRLIFEFFISQLPSSGKNMIEISNF